MLEIIGLSGISCTGKTHFTDQLKNKIPNKPVFSFKSSTYRIIKEFEKRCPKHRHSVILRQFYLIDRVINDYFDKITNYLKNTKTGVIVFDRTPIDYIAYLLTFLEYKKNIIHDTALFNRLCELLRIKYSDQISSNIINLFNLYKQNIVFNFVILAPFENENRDYYNFLEIMCKKKKSRIRFLEEFNIKYKPKLDINQFKKFTKSYYNSISDIINLIYKNLLKRYSGGFLNEKFKVIKFIDMQDFPFEWQNRVLEIITNK